MPPEDFCFAAVPLLAEEDECGGLLEGWLAGALEEPPPQAVTSAMTAPNMIAMSRREVMALLPLVVISSRTGYGSCRDLVQRQPATVGLGTRPAAGPGWTGGREPG